MVSCEKLRGAANRLRSADVRMGQPGQLKAVRISKDMGQRRELKHLSTCRKRKKASISGVVASEKEIAQTVVVTASAGL